MNSALHHFAPSNDVYVVSPDHPNYARWVETERTALLRGELAVRMLGAYTQIENIPVLDIGCGDGGASIAFARRGCRVTATDADQRRINSLKEFLMRHEGESLSITTQTVMGEELPFEAEQFRVVILQGVLEHTQNPQQVLMEVSRVLRPGGCVFMTIPNRLSLYNGLMDPHWGLPLIGFFNRKQVAFIITRILRREPWRPDFAELISIFRLRRYCHTARLRPFFLTREAGREMFVHPEAILWTAAERSIVRFLAKARCDRFVIPLVNNSQGFFNCFITPTWYIVARK